MRVRQQCCKNLVQSEKEDFKCHLIDCSCFSFHCVSSEGDQIWQKGKKKLATVVWRVWSLIIWYFSFQFLFNLNIIPDGSHSLSVSNAVHLTLWSVRMLCNKCKQISDFIRINKLIDFSRADQRGFVSFWFCKMLIIICCWISCHDRRRMDEIRILKCRLVSN